MSTTSTVRPLNGLLMAALPWLSPLGEAVVDAIADHNGRVGRLQFLVRRVGLSSRHQLARVLKSDHLPGVEELSGWISVLAWILEAESSSAPLFRVAHHAHIDPATCYRVVRRVTGRPWTELRKLGLEWLIIRFRERCLRLRQSAPAWVNDGARAASGPTPR